MWKGRIEGDDKIVERTGWGRGQVEGKDRARERNGCVWERGEMRLPGQEGGSGWLRDSMCTYPGVLMSWGPKDRDLWCPRVPKGLGVLVSFGP